MGGESPAELRDGPRLMANRKASVRQSEVTRYLKAMRDAGIAEGRLEITKPDGTRIAITSGKASEIANEGDDIDAMIEKVPHAIS